MNKNNFYLNFMVIFIVIISIINSLYVHADCFQSYCRDNQEEMFVQAELNFNDDYEKGLHLQESTIDNKCKKYHIASIAYAVAVLESDIGKGIIARKNNNLFSVKKGTGKYQYVWKSDYGYSRGTYYLKYPHVYLSILDFMHTYKYGYYCSTSQKSINFYVGYPHERYYQNLHYLSRYFENKYFKYNSLDDYRKPNYLIKNTLQEFKNYQKIISQKKIKENLLVFKARQNTLIIKQNLKEFIQMQDKIKSKLITYNKLKPNLKNKSLFLEKF